MTDKKSSGHLKRAQSDVEEVVVRPDEAKDVYDTLCSLMSATSGGGSHDQRQQCASPASSDPTCFDPRPDCFKSCPKQLQLPMFLSKTYHMIDNCDDAIAGWSEQGDSFVVKDMDRFATTVLPLYFKHSNFSSFARQLNFYSFRKLRSEGILTAAADPQTANYVRFYHQNFQRDKPELLAEIRRATKTDQQSKDDLDALKHEVKTLKHALAVTTAEYDRRLAELSYDFNRRISATNTEFEKLAALVRQLLPNQQGTNGVPNSAFAAPAASDLTAAVVAAAANSILSSSSETAPSQRSQVNLLHSLSQVAAAHALQQQQLHSPQSPQQFQQIHQRQNDLTTGSAEDAKRPAESNGDESSSKQARLSESV